MGPFGVTCDSNLGVVQASDVINHIAQKTVPVSGGAGAIGSNLSEALVQAGCPKVIVVDNLSWSQRWNVPSAKNLLFVEGDITDDVALKSAFNERPEIVFHLAAFFTNQNSVGYPELDLKTNGLGILKLLEYSVLTGEVEQFVQASSGCSISRYHRDAMFSDGLVTDCQRGSMRY